MPDPNPPKRLGQLSFESLVERRIREAQDAGAFDQLPGLGQPIADLDGREDDEWWWIRSWLKREGLSLTPPSLALRKTVAEALSAIWQLRDEAAVRNAALALNRQIVTANFALTVEAASTVAPFDIDEVVRQWQRRRAE